MREIDQHSLDKALEARDVSTLSIDDMHPAIIGLTYENQPRLVYDSEAIIELLMEHGIESYEDAVEFFEFNIRGAYAGEQTPIIIDPLRDAVCH